MNASPTLQEFVRILQGAPLMHYNATRIILLRRYPNNARLRAALRRVDGSCTGG